MADSPYKYKHPKTEKNKFGGGAPRKYEDPVIFPFKLERELAHKFKNMFPGKCSEMLNWFVSEAVKQRPVMVFQMNYPGFVPEEPEVTFKAKMVVQIDPTTNEEVGRYQSIHEASRVTGINGSSISATCLGKIRMASKFIWRYVDDDGSPVVYQEKLRRPTAIHYTGFPCGKAKSYLETTVNESDVTCKRCLQVLSDNPGWTTPSIKSMLSKSKYYAKKCYKGPKRKIGRPKKPRTA